MRKLTLLELIQSLPGARPEGDAEHRTKVRQPKQMGTPAYPYVDTTEEMPDGETWTDEEIAQDLQMEFKSWGSGGRKPIFQRPGYEIDFKGHSTGDASHVRRNNSQNQEKVGPISWTQPNVDIEDEELELFDKWTSGELEDEERGKLPTLGEVITRLRGLPKGDGPITTGDPWAGAGVPPQSTTISAAEEKEREKREAEEDVGLSLESLVRKMCNEYASTDWSRGSRNRISRSDLDFFERDPGSHQFLMNTVEEFEENQTRLDEDEPEEQFE